MLPYSKQQIHQFKSVHLETNNSAGNTNSQRRGVRPARNASARHGGILHDQPGTSGDLLPPSAAATAVVPHKLDHSQHHHHHQTQGHQLPRNPQRKKPSEISSALLSRKVNMIMLGRGGQGESSSVHLKNSLGEHHPGGLQSTLNRHSMDQDPHSSHAIQLYQQSSSVGGTHQSDSKQHLHGSPSLVQHHNAATGNTRAFMIPTMQLGDSGDAVGTDNQSQSFRTKRFSAKTQLLDKQASGMSNSSAGALTSVQEAAALPQQPHPAAYRIDFVRPAALSPKMVGIRAQTQMHESQTGGGVDEDDFGQPRQTQDEILTDIQKRFETFKKLFPAGGASDARGSAAGNQSQKSRRPVGALIAAARERTASAMHRSSRPTTMKPLQPDAQVASNQSTSRVGATGGTQRSIRQAGGGGLGTNHSLHRGSYHPSKFQKQQSRTKSSLLTSDLAANQRLQAQSKLHEASFPQRQIKSSSRENVRRLLSRKTDNVNISLMLQQQELHQKPSPSRSTSNLEKQPQSLCPQKGQVAVLQLDSEQLFNNMTQSTATNNKGFMSRKHAKQLAQQGPIKRLKSAMIRSVFDKGDYQHIMSADAVGLHSNSKQVLKKRRTRQSPTSSAVKRGEPSVGRVWSSDNSMDDSQHNPMLLSTKGQQLAMPTYTYTSPILQEFPPSDYTSLNGGLGGGAPPPILHSHTNSSVLAAQHQNQIFFQHQSHLNEQMAAAIAQDYENYLVQQVQHPSQQLAAMPAFYTNSGGADQIYGGQPGPGGMLMQGGLAQQAFGTPPLVAPGGSSGLQQTDSYQQLMVGSDHPQPAQITMNEPQSAYKIPIPADQYLPQEVTGSSHIVTPENETLNMLPPAMNLLQDDQLIGIIQERSGEGGGLATMAATSQEEYFRATTGKARSQVSVSAAHERRPTENDDGNVVVVPTVGQDLDYGDNDDGDQEEAARGSPGLSALKEGAASLILSLKQQIRSGTNDLKMQDTDQGTLPRRESSSPQPNDSQTVVTGNSTINLKLTKAKDDSQPQLSATFQQAETPTASQDYSQSHTMLAAAQQQQQQLLEYEEKRRKQLELELHQRDYQILSVLGQQIKEDYMHMYNLKQDLQSDMIKIDPRYMNKAIIEKIKIQNRKWQQSALALSTSSPLATEPQLEEGPNAAGEDAQPLLGEAAPAEKPGAIQIMQKRSDGSGQLVELASGLHEIQELEQYITSGAAVHTRTLSQVDQSQLARLHSSSTPGSKPPAFDCTTSGTGGGKGVSAAYGLPNQQQVVVPAPYASGPVPPPQQYRQRLITPDRKQQNENEESSQQFVLHDNVRDGTEKCDRRERDENRIEQNSSPPSHHQYNQHRGFNDIGEQQATALQQPQGTKAPLNQLVTFQDEDEQLQLQNAAGVHTVLSGRDPASGASPLSINPHAPGLPQNQNADTESTPIRRMEKLLNRFELNQALHQNHHPRAAAADALHTAGTNVGLGGGTSAHSATNQDLSGVVDPMAVDDEQRTTTNKSGSYPAAASSKHQAKSNTKMAVVRITTPASQASWLPPQLQQQYQYQYQSSRYDQPPQNQFQVNVMQPVKKFVNINQQTRFAEIKQSILQRNESQLSEGRRSKELARGHSACEGSKRITFTGRPLSPTIASAAANAQTKPSNADYNATNQRQMMLSSLATSLASRGLSLSEMEQQRGVDAAGQTTTASRGKMLLIQDSQNQRDYQEKPESLVYVRVNPARYHERPAPNQQTMNYLDQELSSATPDLSKIWRIKAKDEILSAQLHDIKSVMTSHLGSANETNYNSKDQLISTSMRGSQEALPQQNNKQSKQKQMMRIFDDINIAKLTNDKALNRHIHGMTAPPQTSQIQLKNDKERKVTRQRQKTMMAQVRSSRGPSALALSQRSKEISSSRGTAGAHNITSQNINGVELQYKQHLNKVRKNAVSTTIRSSNNGIIYGNISRGNKGVGFFSNQGGGRGFSKDTSITSLQQVQVSNASNSHRMINQ